jgi:tetratricopeptide (TPR) repeat protein
MGQRDQRASPEARSWLCCGSQRLGAAAMLLTAPAVACKDDFDRVIQDEDQQERLDWKFAQAFNNRCAAYLRQGDYGRAMQDCNQAVRYDAKNAVAFSNRGLAYAGKGELGRAIRDYDEAIRLDPYLTGARLNVSWWRPREP